MLKLILRRQQYAFGQMLLELGSLILAVGMITNASFFAEGVDRVILSQELAKFSRMTGRPPLSTSVYVFPNQQAPLSLENAESLAGRVARTVSTRVGLPLRSQGLLVSGGYMDLEPDPESGLYPPGTMALETVEAVYIGGIAGHISITAGNSMDEEGASSGESLEVWMHETLLQQIAAQPGDPFALHILSDDSRIPVRIAGVWHATDAEGDDFWFNDPDFAYKNGLLVRRQDYLRFIQPRLRSHTREVSWYLILEDQNLSPKNSAAYLAGFSSAEKDLQKAIPGARLNMPPVDPLENFVQRSKILAVLLMAFNLPAFAILLYFLLITSATVAAWQSKDTALLSSRGMSRGRIVRLALAEQGLLALVGCPFGLLFGAILARLMGYTASFLSFTGRAPLPVSSEGISLPLIALALGVYLLARLWPEMRQGKRSVLQTEREWARPLQKPLWYRGGFDLLLLLPSYYAYTQLLRHGTLAALAGDRPEELFRDPLVILLPGLFVMTLSFVMLRLFTIVLRGIDLLAGRIPWLALHLAFRQLGRQAHAVTSPLLLAVVSLAMGSYTLALAASLDRWEGERVHYQAGADLVILPQPLQEDTQVTDWNWIPAPADFKKVEGVLHAARVGEYAAEIELADQEIQARVLAIDRLDFPLVAWYRSDFSTEALGGLMNRLALAPNGVLVSRTFLSQTGLNIGDPLRVRVTIPLMETSQVTFSIAGFYDFFPTVYEEEEGVALIGNLEYLSTSFGFTLPHQLWLKLGLGVSGKAVAEALPEQLGFQGTILRDAGDSLAQEQARLERVGIYGTLTVGFLAGALMAVLGLLVYSYTSLRERVARFVILHALGVQNHQIAAQVFIEFTFLALFGSLAGMWIGSLVARLFIPFLGYTGGKDLPLPPLIPLIEAAPMRSLAILFTVVIVFMEVIVIRAAMLGKSVNRLE